MRRCDLVVLFGACCWLALFQPGCAAEKAEKARSRRGSGTPYSITMAEEALPESELPKVMACWASATENAEDERIPEPGGQRMP